MLIDSYNPDETLDEAPITGIHLGTGVFRLVNPCGSSFLLRIYWLVVLLMLHLSLRFADSDFRRANVF